MEPIQGTITWPRSREEVRHYKKNSIIELFFLAYQTKEAPQNVCRWLTKEIHILSQKNKIPHHLAIEMSRMQNFPFHFPKDTFAINNENQGVTLNKLLLTSSSGFFRKACDYDWEKNHEFYFDDCPDALFDILFDFFRSGNIEAPLELLLPLYEIAQKYEIDAVIDYCHERIASYCGGIRFRRLMNERVELEITAIHDAFEHLFPAIDSQCLGMMNYISSIVIHESALGQDDFHLRKLIDRFPHLRVSVTLNRSVLSAIPHLLKWGKALQRITKLTISTEAKPPDFASSSSTSTLMLKLFERCTYVKECYLKAEHIPADDLVKKITTTMTSLERLELHCPVTPEAFNTLPQALCSLHISAPLESLPASIPNAGMLHELSINVGDIYNLDQLPFLKKLTLLSPTFKAEDLEGLLIYPRLLEELTLPGKVVPDELIEALRKSYLKKVYFTQAHAITNDHLTILANMPHLESFGIEDSNISDHGLQKFLNVKRLRELTIKNCPFITTNGFDSRGKIRRIRLIGLSQLRNLQFAFLSTHLTVKRCQRITDAAITSLRSYNIRILTLKKCLTSHQTLEKLRVNLPGLIQLNQAQMIGLPKSGTLYKANY